MRRPSFAPQTGTFNFHSPNHPEICSRCTGHTVVQHKQLSGATRHLGLESNQTYSSFTKCFTIKLQNDIWHPKKESNLYLKIRSFLFFPLNYWDMYEAILLQLLQYSVVNVLQNYHFTCITNPLLCQRPRTPLFPHSTPLRCFSQRVIL